MKRSDCWQVAEAVLQFVERACLHGIPSTGKTHFAIRAGLALPDGTLRRVFPITMTEETTPMDLIGHKSLENGSIVWNPGIVQRAWATPNARIVYNEFDKARECDAIMHVLLDDPALAELTLGSGEVIRPAPGVQSIATMNGQPEDLSEALRSRLPVMIHIDRVHPDALKSLSQDLRTAAENSTMAEDENFRIALRVWREFDRLRKTVGPEVAAQACFRDRAEDILDGILIAAKK